MGGCVGRKRRVHMSGSVEQRKKDVVALLLRKPTVKLLFHINSLSKKIWYLPLSNCYLRAKYRIRYLGA